MDIDIHQKMEVVATIITTIGHVVQICRKLRRWCQIAKAYCTIFLSLTGSIFFFFRAGSGEVDLLDPSLDSSSWLPSSISSPVLFLVLSISIEAAVSPRKPSVK